MRRIVVPVVLLSLFAVLSLMSCSEDERITDPAGEDPFAADTLFDRNDPTPGIHDQDIWDAAYGGKRTPVGFYSEDIDGGLYYVNTVSITPLAQRQHAWYELSTDDAAQARTWSDLSVEYGSQGAMAIEAERITEKYIEISRQNDQLRINFRAHRSSYLDVSGVDRLAEESDIGTFVPRPVTTDAVRELIEYLWFIRHYQHGGTAVLRVEMTESGTSIMVRLIELQIIYGDWGVRDEIRLIRSDYSVSTVTGKIHVERTTLEQFPGR